MYSYFLCSLLLSSLTRQNKKERKKKSQEVLTIHKVYWSSELEINWSLNRDVKKQR